MKIAVLDTETGGIDHEKTDLLTLYVGMFENHELIDELDLKIKSNETDVTGERIYRVTAKALEINGIDLKEHDATADTITVARGKLTAFLAKHAPKAGPYRKRITVLGQNVHFDIVGIEKRLLPTLKAYVSHEVLDTKILGRILMNAGVIPQGSTSLVNLCKYFKIPLNAHIAKDDALATYKVYRKMLALIPANMEPTAC